MSAFLAKELEDSGIAFNEVIDNVIVVENFLSKEEVSEFMNIIKNTKEEDWFIAYQENLKRFCLQKFGRDDVDNLVAEGKFEVTKGWDDKNLPIGESKTRKDVHLRLLSLINKADSTLELSGIATFQRMQEGVELKAHSDQHTDPSVRYAAIIYLNDDYAGGELFFDKLNFSIKPKPGSLLIFPGTDEYSHGVKHVQNGPIRYIIVGFIKVKDFYSQNIF